MILYVYAYFVIRIWLSLRLDWELELSNTRSGDSPPPPSQAPDKSAPLVHYNLIFCCYTLMGCIAQGALTFRIRINVRDLDINVFVLKCKKHFYSYYAEWYFMIYIVYTPRNHDTLIWICLLFCFIFVTAERLFL